MGISPWYKTSSPTAPKWTIPLVPDSKPFDVTGLVPSNFSLLIRNLDTGAETTGQGTFSNIVAAVTTTIQPGNQVVVVTPASVQYQLALADVALGNYRLWLLATTSNGVQPFLIEEDWEVLPL